jgi:hypothetical protein
VGGGEAEFYWWIEGMLTETTLFCFDHFNGIGSAKPVEFWVRAAALQRQREALLNYYGP